MFWLKIIISFAIFTFFFFCIKYMYHWLGFYSVYRYQMQ